LFGPEESRTDWGHDMKIKKPILESFIDTQRPITEITPKGVITCGEKESLNDVVRTILTEKKRKIPVISDKNHIRGMVTTIDILGLLGGNEKYKVFRREQKDTRIPLKKFMTKHINAMRPETKIERGKF